MTDEHHDENSKFYDRISRAYDLISETDEHEARETGERLLSLTHGAGGTGPAFKSYGKDLCLDASPFPAHS